MRKYCINIDCSSLENEKMLTLKGEALWKPGIMKWLV